jgi:hypothetical protein
MGRLGGSEWSFGVDMGVMVWNVAHATRGEGRGNNTRNCGRRGVSGDAVHAGAELNGDVGRMNSRGGGDSSDDGA